MTEDKYIFLIIKWNNYKAKLALIEELVISRKYDVQDIKHDDRHLLIYCNEETYSKINKELIDEFFSWGSGGVYCCFGGPVDTSKPMKIAELFGKEAINYWGAEQLPKYIEEPDYFRMLNDKGETYGFIHFDKNNPIIKFGNGYLILINCPHCDDQMACSEHRVGKEDK